MKYRTTFAAAVAMILLSGCVVSPAGNISVQGQPSQPGRPQVVSHQTTFGMKGVGIDLPQEDFSEMKRSGIDVVSTEWGMEQGVNKTRKFLDQAYKAGLKVVMDGGFSARAWGFSNDDWDHLPKGKHPVWQKERVQSWIRSLKDHPAIYAWDICNEFGENLPSGAGAGGPDWPASMITIEQLAQAKADVLAADPTRLILVRMYEWDFDNVPPYVKALLSNKIAGIISLNLYSNYLYKGKLQWPDIIKEAGPLCVQTIKKEAPGTTIWLSVAAFEYLNTFERPTAASLERDIREALLISDLDGISFFCWGPVNQWDDKSNWYLPKTGADLWKIIQQDMKKVRGPG